MRPLNVLITAASRRVPLVRAFQSALKALSPGGRVVVTDVNRLSPAVHVADRWYEVPLATDAAYIDTLLAICDAERIGLLIPTIDDELVALGSARGRFAAARVRVAVSPEATSRICNDKFEACRHLREHGVAAAETYLPDCLPHRPPLPLFIKPRFGRGSVGAFPIHTPRELEFFLGYVPGPIVQEYLAGPEFTIDLLCDFHGRPLAIVPRERVVIRSGVIDRGRTVHDPALMDLAAAVAETLPFNGPVNIQCRVVNGRPIVFEINPRFSGGIPLTIAAGADVPRMLVQLALGRRVGPAIGDFQDGLWMTNYEASLFLEEEQVVVGRQRLSMPIGYIS